MIFDYLFNTLQATVYFNDKLLRGNQCTKTDTEAFHSPNMSPLVEMEIHIHDIL